MRRVWQNFWERGRPGRFAPGHGRIGNFDPWREAAGTAALPEVLPHPMRKNYENSGLRSGREDIEQNKIWFLSDEPYLGLLSKRFTK